MSDYGISDHELSQALAGHAATIQPSESLDRLAAGMVRADRLQTVRVACGSLAAVAIVAFGVLSIGGGSQSSIDVVDQPTPTFPDNEIALPDIDDADVAETGSTTTAAPATTVPSTTAAPATDPDHLVTDEPASTTTAAVVTTTVAPVTTSTTAAPAPTTTTAPATTTTSGSVAFTAAARYQSCSEDPAYDEYSGTAAPGTTVSISSPYSSAAQVTADSSGDWFLRVEFPSAPANETFTVSVSDGSATHHFDMVHTV